MPSPRPSGVIMIQIQNLTKTFLTPRGQITVLEDFALTVPDGTFLGIAGKSGSGKSTLISMILGLQKPTSGKILIGNGKNIDFPLTDIFSLDDKNLSKFRNAHIGFVSQEQSFLENLTVFDNVRLPCFLGEKKSGGEKINSTNRRAKRLLASLGISHLEQSFPRDLSGGENHRVLIARALINNPEVILADEPTESVDGEQTEQIVKIFRELSEKGTTVILVSHDEAVLKKCDKIVSLPID